MNDIIQGSPEWFAIRCGRATASRFADILAETKSGPSASRKNYLAQLVVERLTGEVEESYVSADMRHGTETEPLARAAFELATGLDVAEVGFVQVGDDLGCSPDGLIGDVEGIEIKCPNKATHLDTLQDNAMPSKHVAQVQGSLWLTGRRAWHFVSYHPSFPPHLRLFHCVIQRDNAYIARLEKSVGVFVAEVAAIVKKLEAIQ